MAEINDGQTKAWSDETVDGIDFDNDPAAQDFEYQTDPIQPQNDVAPAGYDDDNYGGIVAPEPLVDDKPKKSPTVPILTGAVALLLAAVVGLAVWAFAANHGDNEKEATPAPVVPTQTTTATVTETQKVPDTAAAKKAQDERDAVKRDRDRYREQVGSLRRQNESLRNKAPATVTKTAPPVTVTKTAPPTTVTRPTTPTTSSSTPSTSTTPAG